MAQIKIIKYGSRALFWLLPALLCLPVEQGFAQQDPQFNQYMFNPLGVNPAYAGSREALSAVVLYRNQWVGFEGAPKTQTAAIHAPIKRKKIGLGFQVTNDQIGPRNTIHANATYAYRIRFLKGKLAFGLRTGIINYKYDWNMIEFRDGDAVASQGVRTLTVPNFDFGMYYNTNKFYVGAEVAHLNQPKLSVLDSVVSKRTTAKQFSHITATIGRAFTLNEKVVFRPSLLYKQAGTTAGFVDINANFLFNDVLWVGAAYRPSYGIIALVEYDIAKKIRIGYSFDYPLNDLSYNNAGSHEIFLGFDFDISRSKIISTRYF